MIEEYFLTGAFVLAVMGLYVGIDLAKNKPSFYKNCEMKQSKIIKSEDSLK